MFWELRNVVWCSRGLVLSVISPFTCVSFDPFLFRFPPNPLELTFSSLSPPSPSFPLSHRNYYCRYDYETVDSDAANAMMAHLRAPDYMPGMTINGFTLTGVDDFAYTDPVDGSQATKQGVRLMFGDGTRAVFRLSGTGSTGATVRMYLEKYEPDVSKQGLPSSEVLKPLADLAIKLARLEEFTGRTAPTVIT